MDFSNIVPGMTFEKEFIVEEGDMPNHSGIRKEVTNMNCLLSLLVAITAQVIGHYMCKWLDRHNSGN